jgi:long-chain-fatty-acyl-CoA reductase
MSETIELPVLIAGKRVAGRPESFKLEFDSGITVNMPRPTVADAEAIVASDRLPLARTSVDDLTIFFDRVRQNWMDPKNVWRRMAIDLATKMTGYARPVIESDVNYLGHTLTRLKQYDFIETDLRDVGLLDEWRPRQAVLSRCLPMGLICHIMVGNVPLASLFTLYRSLVTKNITVAKVPSRDVASALCFANCIHDTDPNHPATRALSTLYWESESEFEQIVLSHSDLVSVWGRGDTVDAVRRRVPRHAEFVFFGPKRSLAIVTSAATDLDDVAMRLGFDVSIYDQEACFSAQEAFVQGDARKFGASLAAWLRRYQKVLPRRQLTVDSEAHVQRCRREAEAEGWIVHAPKTTEWTVVVTDGPVRLDSHPAGRFVYVHPIDQVEQVVPLIDRSTQTIAVAPTDLPPDQLTMLCQAGADRIVNVGRMTRFRPGLSHDGMYPMARMVRWVTRERDVSYKYRFMEEDPSAYDERLYGFVKQIARAEASEGGAPSGSTGKDHR